MRTFIPFYAGTPRANHRKTEAFVMDRRVDADWPTRVVAKELPLEADLIVRFFYIRASRDSINEGLSPSQLRSICRSKSSGLRRIARWRRQPPPKAVLCNCCSGCFPERVQPTRGLTRKRLLRQTFSVSQGGPAPGEGVTSGWTFQRYRREQSPSRLSVSRRISECPLCPRKRPIAALPRNDAMGQQLPHAPAANSERFNDPILLLSEAMPA